MSKYVGKIKGATGKKTAKNVTYKQGLIVILLSLQHGILIVKVCSHVASMCPLKIYNGVHGDGHCNVSRTRSDAVTIGNMKLYWHFDVTWEQTLTLNVNNDNMMHGVTTVSALLNI